MSRQCIDRDLVIGRTADLPGFPRVINEILETLDDPEANLNILTHLIQLDQVISARVLSLANKAASHTRNLAEVRDIFTATSLIGMGRVRQMVLVSSCVDHLQKMGGAGLAATFWQHSVAVGVCAEDLALHVSKPVSSSAALIAGLLHDVGQLWLARFNSDLFRDAWHEALAHGAGIDVTERERFGVDHAELGAWLAEHWSLPPAIVAAVRFHHECDTAVDQSLVPVVHVAEVLSNALDLTGRKENRVTHLSSSACTALGLVWDEGVQSLFGRIEARSRHFNGYFA